VISETFSPPIPLDGDRSFGLEFSDGGREFRVTGQFDGNDQVEGDIDDEDDECDVSFDADRIDGGGTPTAPTRTPSPGASAATPGASSTPGTSATTAGTPGATATGGGTPNPTVTGGGPTSTAPTTGPTPGPNDCPAKVTLEGQGSQADLDSGTTGIAFDQTVIDKGNITVSLDCGGRQNGACGSCTVSGPIASTTVVKNQRCINDTAIICDDATPCPSGMGPCAFFFGAPLPLSSGGVPACVTNRVNGTITGTANPDAGSGESQVRLVSTVFTNGVIDRPCPTCSGASFGATGTCTGGPKQGAACTVHGVSPLFGNTSFDCGPGKPTDGSGNLDIQLNPTTGTSTLQPTNTCLAVGFAGKPCYCPMQPKPNDCTDGICTVDANGEGTCQAGPQDSYCTIDTFRGCLTNAECPKAGDSCGAPRLRKCSGATQAETGGIATVAPLSRTGVANKNNPTLVSTFCIPVTASSAVNTAAGLPGPGALRLPSRACFDSTTCTF
jgi:hypothetical protein